MNEHFFKIILKKTCQMTEYTDNALRLETVPGLGFEGFASCLPINEGKELNRVTQKS